ncbi:restriction endonuclease subunit S [Paraclostridium sordellii]
MEYIKCIDIIDVRDGTHDSPKYINDGGYPLITSKNIKNNIIDFENVNYISYEDYIKINKRSSVCNGDIIMPMIGTIGNPVLVNTDIKFAIKNVALFKLSNNNNIDSKFFYYCLKSDKVINQLSKNKRGGTQSFVSLTNLRELKIPNICIRKQKKIVEVLDKAQELIDKRKEQIEALDELVKSRFIEMFGDISRNTKEWDIVKLDELIDVVGGYAFKSTEFVDEGIPVLKIGNINAGYFKPTNLMFWNRDEKLDRYLIKPNDLVISLTGTVGKDDYGNVCIMGNDYEEYYLNQRNAKLDIKSEDLLDKYYLTYALKVPEVKKRLTGISRGVRQANIANKDIQNLELPIPSIDLQHQFTIFVNQIDKLKFEMKTSLTDLEDNFNSLMQKAFKGELF